MPRPVERLARWIDSFPDAIRPAVYGALFIVLFMLARGAWIIAPIAIVYVLLTSDTPLVTLGHGVAVIGLAMTGGALSGLAYGLVGRRLQRAFRGGWYLTGIITIAPYMFVLTYVIRLADHKPLLAPLTGLDLGVSLVMAVLFGLVMGASWFSPPPKAPD